MGELLHDLWLAAKSRLTPVFRRSLLEAVVRQLSLKLLALLQDFPTPLRVDRKTETAIGTLD